MKCIFSRSSACIFAGKYRNNIQGNAYMYKNHTNEFLMIKSCSHIVILVKSVWIYSTAIFHREAMIQKMRTWAENVIFQHHIQNHPYIQRRIFKSRYETSSCLSYAQLLWIINDVEYSYQRHVSLFFISLFSPCVVLLIGATTEYNWTAETRWFFRVLVKSRFATILFERLCWSSSPFRRKPCWLCTFSQISQVNWIIVWVMLCKS